MITVKINKNEVVYHQRQIRIELSSFPTQEAIFLLEKANYGTTGIRYQQTGQRIKLADICPALCFHLFEEDRLAGFFCLDPRQVTWSGKVVTGYYGRYFAIDADSQGKSLGTLLIEQVAAFVRKHSHSPSIIYVYVEGRNVRSVKCFTRSGYRLLSECQTFVFRRFFPRKLYRVVQASALELEQIRQEIATANAESQFFTPSRIGYQEDYYLCFDGDRLIGGVQANEVTWKFNAMPGISGKVMMNILPFLPVVNRLFQPRYKFLAIDSLHLHSDDRPSGRRRGEVTRMIESILAHKQLHTAICQTDVTFHRLLAGEIAGLLSGYQENVRTGLYGLLLHLPEPERKLADNECFISSFDFT